MAKSSEPSHSNSVSVTGNVTNGGIIAGDHNVQRFDLGARRGEQAEGYNSMVEIRRMLADLSGPYADHARNSLDRAIDTASKPEPDKTSLGALMDMALQAAKKTAEFSSVAAGLAPHVQHVVRWLGAEWGQLLTLI